MCRSTYGTLMPRTQDISAFSAGVLPPFQPQAASTQQHSVVSPDVSPTVGARPRSSGSYRLGEYRQLRQQNTEYKFLLWWCLHHLKSFICTTAVGGRWVRPCFAPSFAANGDRAASVWRKFFLWRNCDPTLRLPCWNSHQIPLNYFHFSSSFVLFYFIILRMFANHRRDRTYAFFIIVKPCIISACVIISKLLEPPNRHSRRVISKWLGTECEW